MDREECPLCHGPAEAAETVCSGRWEPDDAHFPKSEWHKLEAKWQCRKCRLEWGVGGTYDDRTYNALILKVSRPSRYELAHDEMGNECIVGVHQVGDAEIRHKLYFAGAPKDLHEETLLLMGRSNRLIGFPYRRYGWLATREAFQQLNFQATEHGYRGTSFPMALELVERKGKERWAMHRYLLECSINE
jgi:hypothetical protein